MFQKGDEKPKGVGRRKRVETNGDKERVIYLSFVLS